MNYEKDSRVFVAKTTDAYRFKILSEIVSNTIKTSFFTISKDGIYMCVFDQFKRILIEFDLKSENFQTFLYTLDEPINVSMTASHFYKMLKSVKKKDVIELSIDSRDSKQLVIKTYPKDRNRVTISSISLQMAHNIKIELPTSYTKSVILQSSDFNKMIKDISSIQSGQVRIKNTSGQLHFTADADGVMQREVVFGECQPNNTQTYDSTFSSERLYKISKISSLNDLLHVHAETAELPLRIRTNIGSLGEFNIYMKSNEIIKQEEHV